MSESNIRNDLAKQLGREPTEDEVKYAVASQLLARDDLAGFYENMEAAVKLAPKNSLYRFVLAKQYAEQGEVPKALENALIAVELAERTEDPIAVTYNKFLGDLYVRERDHLNAEAAYERSLAQSLVLERVPSSSCRHAHGPIATSLADSQRDFNLTKKKLTAQRPTATWVTKNLPWGSRTFNVSSKYRTAAEAYIDGQEEGIRCGRIGGVAPFLQLGSAYRMVGRTEDAVIVILAATISHPKDAQAWHELGWAYLQQGRLEDSLAAFNKACRLGSKPSCSLISPVKKLITRYSQNKRSQL